jgi:hypothetical protein
VREEQSNTGGVLRVGVGVGVCDDDDITQL